jgi:hypothetical protein
MKSLRFIALLLSTSLFVACQDHKQGSSTVDSEDSIQMQTNYDSIVDSHERAHNDTAYHHSEEYRYAQENYHRNIAEKTAGMSHTSQVLYEYELAINALINAKSAEVKQYQGVEVIRLYDQLKKMDMTPEEKQRFNQINKKQYEK